MARRSLLAALLCCACGAAIRATVIVPASLDELVLEARAIAAGRVVATEARWVDGRRSIETFVTLDVAEYLKGNLGDTVVFRVPGGELGAYRTMIAGAPEFDVGDEVVLFLSARGPAIPHIVGFSQGVFRVVRGSDGGSLVIPVPLTAPAAEPERVARGDVRRRPVPLAEFRALVRSSLMRGAQGPQGVRREP